MSREGERPLGVRIGFDPLGLGEQPEPPSDGHELVKQIPEAPDLDADRLHREDVDLEHRGPVILAVPALAPHDRQGRRQDTPVQRCGGRRLAREDEPAPPSREIPVS
jgi:hypothetical protein